MIKYYMVNGKLLPKELATLNIGDLAIIRGYGVFDFFVVKRGRPLFFDDYLDRFERSAKEMGLPIPFTRTELKQQILQTIEANQLEWGGLKLILTGGYSEDHLTPATPNLLVIVSPPPKYPDHYYKSGIKLILREYHRTLPGVKSTNYLKGVSLLPQMKAEGAEEALFCFDGNLTETTRANFFLVEKDGTIVTAGEEVLKGVTRKKILEIARKHYNVEERNVSVKELQNASEAFISSSTRQLMPVVKIDDLVIGNGKPGPITKRLHELLKAEEQAYLDEIAATVGVGTENSHP